MSLPYIIITADRPRDSLTDEMIDDSSVLCHGNMLLENARAWACGYKQTGYKNVSLITTKTRPIFRYISSGPSYGMYYDPMLSDIIESVN